MVLGGGPPGLSGVRAEKRRNKPALLFYMLLNACKWLIENYKINFPKLP